MTEEQPIFFNNFLNPLFSSVILYLEQQVQQHLSA